MKTRFIIFAAFILFMTGSLQAIAREGNAQEPDLVIKLYPGGAPESNDLSGDEIWRNGSIVSNVSDPEMLLYLADAGTRTGQFVIVCPGGAYAMLSFDNEGKWVAEWLNGLGISAAVLKHRMPNGHHDIPTKDVWRAIGIVREHAAEWGVNPANVGIMGFSAGGNLVTTAGTLYASTAERPDFVVAVYPVVTMSEPETHKGSRDNLLGREASPELIRRYSAQLNITPDTPPMFIAFSDEDKAVDPRNGTMLYDALHKKGVSAELHIYPGGFHGWGFEENFEYKEEFRTALARWLRQRSAD